MSLFDNNKQSFEQLRREFRWRIPEYYNIGVDVCDKHTGRFDEPALSWEVSATLEADGSFSATVVLHEGLNLVSCGARSRSSPTGGFA